MYIFLIIIIIIILILIFIFSNNLLKINEHFCKIPKYNNQYEINDKKVFLSYKPQSNIKTSSCDQYWKDWPLEANSSLIDSLPNVIYSDQLNLPIEKQFGNKQYQAGLIDFNKLADLISENIDKNIFNDLIELLIDPITKNKFNYMYELNYAYIILNKKTSINRWENYNPDKEVHFNYDDIKSPIEDINSLNIKFKERCDILQKKLLTEEQLVLFGLINFEIFKYKIINIYYLNSDILKPVYVIEITLYRHTDFYINTFSFIGYIKENNPYLINVKYVGRNPTDTVLQPDAYNDKTINQKIINSDFNNDLPFEQDPDAIVSISKKHKEQYKLKNQYACFNINYDPNKKNEYILPYTSLDTCQSSFDRYGRSKEVGLYDKPCKEDKDCPFFKINNNYDNNFGSCKSDGYCELPTNMKAVGYRYYIDKEKPLCYNCLSDKFQVITTLDTCCDEQYDKTKYPFLKSPDYSFLNDDLERKNYFNNKFCKTKLNSLKLECDKIIL